jgi:translation initiation factor eIF-2B subunit beta
MATAHLLLRVVAKSKWTNLGNLLENIKDVGQRLVEAQPREIVVRNIVRRVLGMIRDEAKEDREDISDSATNSQVGSPKPHQSELFSTKHEGLAPSSSRLRFEAISTPDSVESSSGDDVFGSSKIHGSRPPLVGSHSTYAGLTGTNVQKSMFDLLAETPSPSATPSGATSPHGKTTLNTSSLSQRMSASTKDLKAEVINGIEEIIDELDQVDDQIAAYALDHIHSNEVILTHSSSMSVQKFLLKAAEKRKFTVVVTESYPNDHLATHAAITGKVRQEHEGGDEMNSDSFLKPLAAVGITVVLIPDSSIFNIMSRVNKVILATHAVIANGGLIAAAGARIIAKAAKVHRTPVIVVSGVYKLSPEYPFEFDSLIEYGDPGNVIGYDNGALVENLEIDNPLFDFVPPDLVDLYITNL